MYDEPTKMQSAGQLVGKSPDAVKARPPIEQSLERLHACISEVTGRAELLIDGLKPVMRAAPTTGGVGNGPRETGDCLVSDVINGAVDRLDSLLNQIESARDRLCI
jgi:hypothetical protein